MMLALRIYYPGITRKWNTHRTGRTGREHP